MSENIMLDFVCLSRGIPPLSMGADCALKMIKKMERAERREVLRKIRKFTKLEINRRCKEENIHDRFKEANFRAALKNRVSMCKSNSGPLRDVFLLARLNYVKSYFGSKLILRHR